MTPPACSKRKWNDINPYIAILAVSAIVIDGFVAFLSDSSGVYTPFFFVCYCLTCSLLPINPFIGSVAIIVLDMIWMLFPQADAGVMNAGKSLAIAILFSLSQTTLAVGVFIIDILVCMYASYIATGGIAVGLVYLFFPVIASFVGSSVKQLDVRIKKREQMDVEERKRMQYKAHEREIRLASQLHDTLTNNLSYVAMVARVEQERAYDNNSRSKWLDIEDKAHDAFVQAHHVIDKLTENNVVDNSIHLEKANKQAQSLILAQLAQGKQDLHELGFDGTTELSMEPSSLINGSQYEEVGMLITELFANIRRHSTPGENAYLIHIEFNEREAIVTQINTVKEHNSMTYERSNKGLGFHKHIIESHGGQLKTSIEDGTWFLYAKIPNSDERHA